MGFLKTHLKHIIFASHTQFICILKSIIFLKIVFKYIFNEVINVKKLKLHFHANRAFHLGMSICLIWNEGKLYEENYVGVCSKNRALIHQTIKFVRVRKCNRLSVKHLSVLLVKELLTTCIHDSLALINKYNILFKKSNSKE